MSTPPGLQEIFFADRRLRVGRFRAAPDHPRFVDSGPIREHVFVFPRRAVWIAYGRNEGLVADPTVVTLYNEGQVYRRRVIDPRGDDSVWVAPTPRLLVEALGPYDDDVRPSSPFRRRWVRIDAETVLLQFALVRYLAEANDRERLVVEETALTLLERVAAGPGPERQRPLTTDHRALADAACQLINQRYAESLSVADIATIVGCSPFHLLRIFRRATGTSLHAFRTQVRLRKALVRLGDHDGLTDLALDLGFASHSHFTSRFTAAFGQPPSVARRAWSTRRLRQLTARLAASRTA